MAKESVRAGLYTRISSDRDPTRLGVERQEQDCQKICKDRGWQAEVYCDNDISATNPRKRRPAYERLLEDIKAGRINAVVVWAEDRLHRVPIELESFVSACDVAGLTKLASVGGDIDLNNPDALILLRLKVAMAAREVAVSSRRQKRKMLEKAESGQPHGGPRPFGYQRVDGTLVVDDYEEALVK